MSTPGAVHAQRALRTFGALTGARLYEARRHLFGRRRWWWGRRHYEHLWPFADAWSATATLASLAGGRRARDVLPGFMAGVSAYGGEAGPDPAGDARPDPAGHGAVGHGAVGFESSVTAPLGPGGDRYYDDNAWVGLALVAHHRLRPGDGALDLARRVFAFVVSGWSTDVSWRNPGGIRWIEPASSLTRNTCANAPAAELGALLSTEAGDEACRWALRIYDWVRATLRRPDGLYADHVSPDGTLDPAVWSYNQGSMIGAGVLLHRRTGEAAYLSHAQETARAAMARFDVPLLASEGPTFAAVFLRNLLLLDDVAPDPRHRALALAFADHMWEHGRDRRTGLFGGGAAPLNPAAGMVQVLALAAGAPPHP